MDVAENSPPHKLIRGSHLKKRKPLCPKCYSFAVLRNKRGGARTQRSSPTAVADRGASTSHAEQTDQHIH